jgi:hypothetical protein
MMRASEKEEEEEERCGGGCVGGGRCFGAVTENRENVKRDKKRVTWSNEVSRFFFGDSQLTGPAAKRARTPATAVRRLRDLQEGRKTRRKRVSIS